MTMAIQHNETITRAHSREWWDRFAELPEDERVARMRTIYAELEVMSEEERRNHIAKLIDATYVLTDEDFRAVTHARLRAWLDMEHEHAALLACSYDEVMKRAPGALAMRRVSFVQTIMREFTDEEQERLRTLNPDERARGLLLTNLRGFSPSAETRRSDDRNGDSASVLWGFWKRRRATDLTASGDGAA